MLKNFTGMLVTPFRKKATDHFMLLIFDMNFCMILLGRQDTVEMGLLYYSNTRSIVPFTALIWALVTTWPVKQLSSFTISLLAALQTQI